MDFYENLKTFSLTPSYHGTEETIRDILVSKLEGFVDLLEEDDVGNLYAVKKGSKPGNIIFSSHQDKVNDCRYVGYAVDYMKHLNSNLVFTSLSDFYKALENKCYILDNGKYRALTIHEPEDFVELPLAPEIFLRNGLRDEPFYLDCESEDSEDFIDDEYTPKKLVVPLGLRAKVGRIKQDSFKGLYSSLPFIENEKHLKGKLDNSMGLSLIIDLMEKTKNIDTPSLWALLTVGEEVGSVGAKYACDYVLDNNMDNSKIIVLDTTSIQPKKAGGIVLYEGCGRHRGRGKRQVVSSKEPLVLELEEFARKNKFPLETHPAHVNDSGVFASWTEIPTVALEVPIVGMHSSQETCLKENVETMRHFLFNYVTEGNL